MSHTVTVNIEFKNHVALAGAVERLGGKVLGHGEHRLFNTTETGFGFNLPGWRKILVAKDNGTLAYDDYNGAWGNKADIDKLKLEYANGAMERKAKDLGWQTERKADGSLTVYHPEGGTLTYNSHGEVDANGFNGVGCKAASEAMASSIGEPVAYHAKPAYYQQEEHLDEGA